MANESELIARADLASKTLVVESLKARARDEFGALAHLQPTVVITRALTVGRFCSWIV